MNKGIRRAEMKRLLDWLFPQPFLIAMITVAFVALILLFSQCSKKPTVTPEQKAIPTVTPTPNKPVQGDSVKMQPTPPDSTRAERPKRASTLKVAREAKTPTKPLATSVSTPTASPTPIAHFGRLLEVKYAGDVIPGPNFVIPKGVHVAIDTTPNLATQPYVCVFKEGLPVNIPCEVDFKKADGQIERWQFGWCFKLVLNEGKIGDPDPRIFPKRLVKDESCAAERQRVQSP